MRKAVNGTELGSMRARRQPEWRSREVKINAFRKMSKISSIRRSGYVFLTICLFSAR